MSEQKICPVCNQKREKLISLSRITERLHGITISRDGKYVDKVCYSCRAKAEKELRKKGSARLIGNSFSILIFGYSKYLDKIKRHLKISNDLYDRAINFIRYQFLKWNTHIDNKEMMKYYIAVIIILLQEKKMVEKGESLKHYIKKHHTNISMNDINEAIEGLKNWCKRFRDYNPFE